MLAVDTPILATEEDTEIPRTFRAPALKTVFDGTWRPRYEAPGIEASPDVVSLAGGIYECHSCHPPYRAPADGRDQVIDGSPRFETIAITVVDDRTVRQVGRRGGEVVYECTSMVAADGNTRTETWTAAMKVGDVLVPVMTPLSGAADGRRRPVLFSSSATRVGPATAGAHLLTGSWKVVELDLLNHEEDTTYRITGGALTMSDGMGRSFTAGLDGVAAPYDGDDRFTGVSVRVIDERTIEEVDFSGDEVVQVTRWRVDQDGQTMHVRFDDTRGHVMEQTGYKLP